MNINELTDQQVLEMSDEDRFKLSEKDYDAWFDRWLRAFHGPRYQEYHLSNLTKVDWEKDKHRVISALEFIPADNRDDWIMVGMALKSANEREGFQVFDQWSHTCPDKYDFQRTLYDWNSFKGEGITIASIFAKALANGWSAPNNTDVGKLPEHKTVNLENVSVNNSELSNKTIEAVRKTFAAFPDKHDPSEDHWKGLRHIAKIYEFMAARTCAPNFYVSFLPPGTGKTTVVVEETKILPAIKSYGYDNVGVIYFLSRLEEIRKLADDMGLARDDYSVMTSDEDFNRQGNDNWNNARVLFTTQQRLEAKCKNKTVKFADMQEFWYKGKPRQVRVWDEAILPSMILTVERWDIHRLFSGLSKANKQELVSELHTFANGLESVNDSEFVTMPDIEKHDISLEEMRSYFDATDREIAEALWYLSDRTVRVRKDNYGTTTLDYEDILPEDLAPMLILDASGQQRKTYEFWYQDRKGLQFLHSPQKSYKGLTIHHWDRGSGKKKHFKDVKTIAEGVAKTINNDIPKDDEVLVVHFKATAKYDVEKEIRKNLEGNKDKVSFLNWGRHTATNKYAHIKAPESFTELEFRKHASPERSPAVQEHTRISMRFSEGVIHWGKEG